MEEYLFGLNKNGRFSRRRGGKLGILEINKDLSICVVFDLLVMYVLLYGDFMGFGRDRFGLRKKDLLVNLMLRLFIENIESNEGVVCNVICYMVFYGFLEFEDFFGLEVFFGIGIIIWNWRIWCFLIGIGLKIEDLLMDLNEEFGLFMEFYLKYFNGRFFWNERFFVLEFFEFGDGYDWNNVVVLDFFNFVLVIFLVMDYWMESWFKEFVFLYDKV